ncbi:MAG: YgiQ family radical SAM protein [Nitrospinae bacterium]|nr:YgiQ family radical SAM protein [Nitrospinota bacterium]
MHVNLIPTTLEEAKRRGWEALDVILVTGDAYVDHPSFGVAVVARFLESLGLRVGVIAAPDLGNPADFLKLGAPSMFFGVTSGNLDSMIMRHTAQKKPRSDDAYAEGGLSGKRPPRATIAYCNRVRELFPGAKIIIGGLEASLRRFAHYDYWSDKVRRSILPDSKADMLVYGMAERPLGEIVEGLMSGKTLKEMTSIRGTAVMAGAGAEGISGRDVIELPSFESAHADKLEYSRASRVIHMNQNPWSAKTLVQKHGERFLKVNPPAGPFSTKELDAVYDLPFTRVPHPSHKEKIPAYEMIRHSITAIRGCFGGCAFCALTVHQGKTIQSRSEESILREVDSVKKMKDFAGYISDIGGPTANMYGMKCGDQKAEAVCRRESCVHPNVCKNLVTSHKPQLEMLKKARSVKGVKKVFVASGVRYDLANLSPEYIKELAAHHVSGQLKVAPEHSNPETLAVMRKPGIEEFERFSKLFLDASKKAGLEQYIVPYFISAHPGCGIEEQVGLAIYLKEKSIRPRQVQDFIPAPLTLAGDIYYSGVDPLTGKKVYAARGDRERRFQRALLQYFKPENADDVRAALKMAGREDLIGYGGNKLVGYERKNSPKRPATAERTARKFPKGKKK